MVVICSILLDIANQQPKYSTHNGELGNLHSSSLPEPPKQACEHCRGVFHLEKQRTTSCNSPSREKNYHIFNERQLKAMP